MHCPVGRLFGFFIVRVSKPALDHTQCGSAGAAAATAAAAAAAAATGLAAIVVTTLVEPDGCRGPGVAPGAPGRLAKRAAAGPVPISPVAAAVRTRRVARTEQGNNGPDQDAAPQGWLGSGFPAESGGAAGGDVWTVPTVLVLALLLVIPIVPGRPGRRGRLRWCWRRRSRGRSLCWRR